MKDKGREGGEDEDEDERRKVCIIVGRSEERYDREEGGNTEVGDVHG